MDRREAKDILDGYSLLIAEETDLRHALDLAIESLQEKHQLSGETSTISEKESVDCISRADTIKAMCRECKVFPDDVVNCADCTEVAIVKGMPTCNQTCNKKQVTGKLKNPDDSLLTDDSEACKEQKSKLDCISREQAIEAIADIEVINHDQLNIREGAVFMLEQLPPVTPTERTGEWEHDGSDWENRWVCSECGYKLFEEQTTYCGNCGAKMKGGTENE